ncbi:MAG: bifunctional metallophosphatase/5'-nucleotidase [Pedosphaera sp.]|nr:bifunctional metallophosphatase/5'-nucleotidase [Pedosphaera sp.]
MACFGNHEFDDNTPLVRSLILPDTAVGYLGTTFPYLSANLNFATDSSLASLVTADGQEATTIKNKIARSTVVTVAGQRIGIVGCTTPMLRTISSPDNIGVFQDLVRTIQPTVDQLLALGINKVIVLAHLQQYVFELELASQLRDVDVVIAGGNHAVFANPGNRLRSGDSAEQPYPVRRSTLTGEPVLVVSTAANYRYLGRLMVSFNEAGLIQSVDPKSGPHATDALDVQDTGNVTPSPVMVSVITNLAAIVDGKDCNRFGRTAVYLNGLRNSVRSEESNLGNLTADANLFRAQKTDPTTTISLKNGGGIRDSIGGYSSDGGSTSLIPPMANPRVGKQSGEVSQLDIENSLRFNNTLSLLTLTAQQVRDTLEWAVAGIGTPGQFPQFSGLQMSFNPTNKPMTYLKNSNGVAASIDFPGERLRNLGVVRPDDSLDLVVENGRLVGSPDRTFRTITLNYLASGGDNYFALTLAKDRVDLTPAGTSMSFSTDVGEQ